MRGGDGQRLRRRGALELPGHACGGVAVGTEQRGRVPQERGLLIKVLAEGVGFEPTTGFPL